MFITKFSTENWIGNQNRVCVKQAQNWQEIESAIRELDGYDKTLVTLETNHKTHMAVGGGAGKYIVYLTFDNESFYSLVDPTQGDKDEAIVVGGQEGIYPAKSCVGLSATLKVAKTFAEFGTLEKSVIWETDDIIERV